MCVLSVDLASRRYRDNGIALLQAAARRTKVEILSADALGLRGAPEPQAFAEALHSIALARDVRVILLDGPQGWRAERSEVVHQRRCERETGAPGKTGLPGVVKPATWTRMALFSVAMFEALAERGWPRITSSWQGERVAIESFPTQAWRSLGLSPLPSRAKTTSLAPWRSSLASAGFVTVPESATHDETQAVVAGIAGLQLLAGGFDAVDARGTDPFLDAGHWREGWIVSPRRQP